MISRIEEAGAEAKAAQEDHGTGALFKKLGDLFGEPLRVVSFAGEQGQKQEQLRCNQICGGGGAW